MDVIQVYSEERIGKDAVDRWVGEIGVNDEDRENTPEEIESQVPESAKRV